MTKKKITKIVQRTKEERKQYKLRPDDIQYIIELANEHSRWSVERIFKEALAPRIRTCLIVPLTPKLKKGLKSASDMYQIGALDVIYHILEEWLKAHKYI